MRSPEAGITELVVRPTSFRRADFAGCGIKIIDQAGEGRNSEPHARRCVSHFQIAQFEHERQQVEERQLLPLVNRIDGVGGVEHTRSRLSFFRHSFVADLGSGLSRHCVRELRSSSESPCSPCALSKTDVPLVAESFDLEGGAEDTAQVLHRVHNQAIKRSGNERGATTFLRVPMPSSRSIPLWGSNS